MLKGGTYHCSILGASSFKMQTDNKHLLNKNPNVSWKNNTDILYLNRIFTSVILARVLNWFYDFN